MSDVIAGAVFEHPYPFVRDEYHGLEADGPFTAKTWRPGIKMEPEPPDGFWAVADAMGKRRLTVIDVFKPGRFPTRVFFTQTWIRPTGREFGKPKLRITTLAAFRSSLDGYRHPFDVRPSDMAVAS